MTQMAADERDPESYAVIGAAIEVHRALGHGFLEAARGTSATTYGCAQRRYDPQMTQMAADERDPEGYAVIGAAIEVHRALGDGFLEAARGTSATTYGCARRRYDPQMTQMAADERDPEGYAVIGAAIEVHRALGDGFLEAARGTRRHNLRLCTKKI